MSTLFVNRLTVIDFSLLDPERGLLGESWIADILLEGALDAQGMVLDFARVKRQVKEVIDRYFDHRLLVPGGYGGTRLAVEGSRCRLEFEMTSGEHIGHDSPCDAVAVIDSDRITPGSVSRAIVERLQPALPGNVSRIELSLSVEPIQGAWYQYSHGLRHHDGNCQRIAHGHRSRIAIHRDGARSDALERAWSERWRDIYIGTRGDLAAEREIGGVPYLAFGYRATQGDFRLELPKRCCYLIDTDSTVENLAEHIARSLKREHPASAFRVQAFEGVDKGALGFS